MTDKKFTDDEIITALECCVKSNHFGECFENKCPLVSEKGCKVGKETLYPYALSLINRQKSEIERLDKLVIEKHKEINRLDDYMQYIRAEAIKEFAEKFKPKVDCEYGNKFYRDHCFEAIDQIAKELTEGNK